MGYAQPEVGMCEQCGYDGMLYPVEEDCEPTHCEACLAFLSARFEAYADEERD